MSNHCNGQANALEFQDMDNPLARLLPRWTDNPYAKQEFAEKSERKNFWEVQNKKSYRVLGLVDITGRINQLADVVFSGREHLSDADKTEVKDSLQSIMNLL